MRKATICLLSLGLIAWGSSTAMAGHSSRGCHNCHVPHHAGDPSDPSDHSVPLWSTVYNSDGLKYTFDLYSSTTFNALATDIGQPDGPSKMCLGCHDGSYVRTWNPAYVFGATDLRKTHPISFTYDSGLVSRTGSKLKDPSVALSTLPGGGTIKQDMLDGKSKMQCTSCHDVHSSGVGADMLRFDFNYTTNPRTDNILCRVCHNK